MISPNMARMPYPISWLYAEARSTTFSLLSVSGLSLKMAYPRAANTVFQMLLEMGAAEIVGPIQIGLNKPIHFTSIDTSVRDIVNLTTMAVIDANVYEKVTLKK